MASQVLSGTSNPSYTNNTGQNVRVVINYLGSLAQGQGGNLPALQTISVSWAGVSAGGSTQGAAVAIGRGVSGPPIPFYVPTEIILAPGQAFSAIGSSYNIVVIPENG